MDYLLAVDHLTSEILKAFPQEKKGCIRRQAHAALSVRRYLVNIPPALKDTRNMLNKRIATYRRAILLDSEAPRRDKVAVLLLLLGNRFFDNAWKGYARWKNQQ